MGSLLDNSLQVMSQCTRDSLFVRLWPLTETPKGLVYIVHEIGGHCLLYDEIAAKFNEKGFAVAANDHYGHGLSGGTRLHVSNYQTYVKDTVQCLREFMSHNPEVEKVILLGHGVGALFACIVAVEYPELVGQLILHAPILKMKDEYAAKLNLCWYASYIVPYLYNPYSGLDPEDLIADEKERRRYVSDPWIWHEGPRFSTVHAILSAMQALQDLPDKLECRTLVQYGEKDLLIDLESLQKNVDKVFSGAKVVPYEAAKHFLHMDRMGIKAQVLEDMIDFCDPV